VNKKRKPKEKLSDRLTELFLNEVERYSWIRFDWLAMRSGVYDTADPSLNLAKKMSKHVMNMIREYEPEDIE